jgi:hypothetical protein
MQRRVPMSQIWTTFSISPTISHVASARSGPSEDALLGGACEAAIESARPSPSTCSSPTSFPLSGDADTSCRGILPARHSPRFHVSTQRKISNPYVLWRALARGINTDKASMLLSQTWAARVLLGAVRKRVNHPVPTNMCRPLGVSFGSADITLRNSQPTHNAVCEPSVPHAPLSRMQRALPSVKPKMIFR